jgi:hypothetical protein
LRFAKDYLSNNKADSKNNPSFISFMSFEDSRIYKLSLVLKSKVSRNGME